MIRTANTPHGPATSNLLVDVLWAVVLAAAFGMLLRTFDPSRVDVALIAAAMGVIVAARGWRNRFTRSRRTALQLVDDGHVLDDPRHGWTQATTDPRHAHVDDPDFFWLYDHDLIAPGETDDTLADHDLPRPVVLTDVGHDAIGELGLDTDDTPAVTR